MTKNKNFLSNKTILVTGGTGSFGQLFVNTILKKFKDIKKIIVFSRDELKQFEMAERLPIKKYPKLRYFIGDLRDKDRVYRALDDVNIVVHAAALKQVPTAEYNPFEYVKTNVLGAQNLIEACLDKNVKNVIALSTDKAVSPINLYGATKLCSDKIFLAANNVKGNRDIKFSVVRYGNVFSSRGSVVPLFLKQKKNNKFTVTDKKMTRFHLTLNHAVEMVLWAIKNNNGGEIFVSKIPSYRILDLVKAISPNAKVQIIGIRPGEKLDEELITIAESVNTIGNDKYYIILNPDDKKNYLFYKKKGFKKLKKIFSYNSGNNKNFLNISSLKKLIKNYNEK